jgi:lysosomal alpha-mannosidase
MGFDGMFFGRDDYQDYDQRNRTKNMEMVWKASANLGKKQTIINDLNKRHILLDRQSWLFTGILPNGYAPPNTFCFDFVCKDEPIIVSILFCSFATIFLYLVIVFMCNFESVIG